MRSGVRAVIIDNGGLLLLKQSKNGEEYFIFPGGGVEEGESDEEALMRECIEEIGMQISVGDLVLDLTQHLRSGRDVTERFYYCSIISFSSNVAEFIPVRAPFDKIASLDLRPKKVKEILIT